MREMYDLAMVHAVGYSVIAITLVNLFGNDLPTIVEMVTLAPILLVVIFNMIYDIRQKKGDNNDG